MFKIEKPEKAPEVEREPFFAVEGKTYTIPKRFLPTDMLQYLHILNTTGGDAAAKWALHYSLGDEGFWALVDAGAAVDEHMLSDMINCVTGRMLGMNSPVPGPKAEPGPVGVPLPETASTVEPPDEEVWPEEESAEPSPA